MRKNSSTNVLPFLFTSITTKYQLKCCNFLPDLLGQALRNMVKTFQGYLTLMCLENQCSNMAFTNITGLVSSGQKLCVPRTMKRELKTTHLLCLDCITFQTWINYSLWSLSPALNSCILVCFSKLLKTLPANKL